MANEQNKDTKDTSFDVNKQSTDFSDKNPSDISNSATTDFGNGEFGNAGTTNPDFSASKSSGTNPSDTKNQFGSTDTQIGSKSDKTDAAGLSVESAKETAKGLYDQAKSTAGQAFGAATKRATEVLDEQKGTVAGGLTTVADTIKQVGENLNTAEEPNKITETAAKYTNSLAEQIENISGYFERKDVRDMVRDVESFARRYPAYFIGGAVALGFLAARFLKSSNPKQLTRGEGRSFNEGYDTGKKLTGETTSATNKY
jgi:hypothetical protein